jgi:hypothetical protein
MAGGYALNVIRDRTRFCEFFNITRFHSSLPEPIDWPKNTKRSGFKMTVHLAGEKDYHAMIDLTVDDRQGGLVMVSVHGSGFMRALGEFCETETRECWWFALESCMAKLMGAIEKRCETLSQDVAHPIPGLDDDIQKELEGLWRLRLRLT